MMADTPNPAHAPAWRVTGQQTATRADPAGRFVHGVVVSFTTAAGHSGEVFAPDAVYTPDRVRAMVAAAAAQMDAIGSLQG